MNSLASKVNAAIASFPAVPQSVRGGAVHPQNSTKARPDRPSSSNLAARVTSKLEDGDIPDAIRLAANDDIMAPFNDVTAAALRAKHPPRAVSENAPLPKWKMFVSTGV